MDINFYPLNKVHEFMNKLGYEPGYAYDDLVFSNDAVFIVQFDKNDNKNLGIYLNKDCINSEADRIKKEFKEVAKQDKIKVSYNGTFSLQANPKTEEIDILFSDK